MKIINELFFMIFLLLFPFHYSISMEADTDDLYKVNPEKGHEDFYHETNLNEKVDDLYKKLMPELWHIILKTTILELIQSGTSRIVLSNFSLTSKDFKSHMDSILTDENVINTEGWKKIIKAEKYVKAHTIERVETKLAHFAINNKIEKVMFLLMGGINVNVRYCEYYSGQYYCDDKTILMLAIQKGHNDLVNLLLTYGADVNKQTKMGDTAVISAARSNNLEALKLLLNRNANVDVTKPLCIALTKGYRESVEFLLSYARNINAINKTLISAVREGCKILVELLLAQHADVNTVDNRGNTAIICAIQNYRQERVELLELIKILLVHKAKVNICNNDGDTALIIAARKNYVEIVKLLLLYDADTDVINNDEDTALIIVARNGYQEILRILLNSNANIEIQDKFGKSAFDYVQKRQPSIKMVLSSINGWCTLC